MAADTHRPRRTTVRLRTTLVATGVVAVTLALAGIGLGVFLHRSQVASLQSTASLRATEIAGLVAAGRLPSPIPVKADDSSLVQVVDDNGRVVGESENIVGEERLARFVPAAGQQSAHTLRDLPIADPDTRYRVVARTVTAPDGHRTVYVATSLGTVDANLRQLGAVLAVGLPALLALVGGTTWVIVGRALRPVERIRADVADLSATDLSRRVPEPGTADEIGRLATTMTPCWRGWRAPPSTSAASSATPRTSCAARSPPFAPSSRWRGATATVRGPRPTR